jgi:hypothetical protein
VGFVSNPVRAEAPRLKLVEQRSGSMAVNEIFLSSASFVILRASTWFPRLDVPRKLRFEWCRRTSYLPGESNIRLTFLQIGKSEANIKSYSQTDCSIPFICESSENSFL